MNQHIDMAHVMGEIAKWAIMIVGLLISGVLSYFFYTTITPPDKPWFAWLSLGLTEGGFALWFATFMLSKHHAYFKSIAMLMTVACGLASFIVAGTELHVLFQTHYSLANDASAYDTVSLAIEVIFFMHLLSIMLELFGVYFAQPGHQFRNPTGFPTPTPQRTVKEAEPQYQIDDSRQSMAMAQTSGGPGLWESFIGLFHREKHAAPASLPPGKTQEEQDEWLAGQQLREERQAAEEKQRMADARSRVLAKQEAANAHTCHSCGIVGGGTGWQYYGSTSNGYHCCPRCAAKMDEDYVAEGTDQLPAVDERPTVEAANAHYRALTAQPGATDRKATAEKAAKQRTQPPKKQKP